MSEPEDGGKPITHDGFTVAAFYRFTALAPADLETLRESLLLLGAAECVKGTVLLAREGVNGTVSGPDSGVESLLDYLQGAHPGLEGLEVKRHHAQAQAFHRFKVRLKKEIVSLGLPEVDPTALVGTYVAPADWKDRKSTRLNSSHSSVSRMPSSA